MSNMVLIYTVLILGLALIPVSKFIDNRIDLIVEESFASDLAFPKGVEVFNQNQQQDIGSITNMNSQSQQPQGRKVGGSDDLMGDSLYDTLNR